MEIHGKILDLSTPAVMGVVNISPDSFYRGSVYRKPDEWIEHTGRMINEGADIVDLGAVSTRPGAILAGEEEERALLIPAIRQIRQHFPDVIISADTFRSGLAEEAIAEGADIINDISGGKYDRNMFSCIGAMKVPYIMMHIQGTPENMQINPVYKDVVSEIKDFFRKNIDKLKTAGVDKIIIDPGFGFGKTVEHNYILLKHLDEFLEFGFPILAGVSRKSLINRVLKTSPSKALNGTTVLNCIALLNGANILRVHDVKAAVEAVKLVSMYNSVS